MSMEDGCGIYRTAADMQATCDKIAELKQRYRKRAGRRPLQASGIPSGCSAIELGYLLDVAQAIAYSALNRKESRGAHQRLDGFEQRDDANFLKHSLAHYRGAGPPRITTARSRSRVAARDARLRRRRRRGRRKAQGGGPCLTTAENRDRGACATGRSRTTSRVFQTY